MYNISTLVIKRRHAVNVLLRLAGFTMALVGLIMVAYILTRSQLWGGIRTLFDSYDSVNSLALGVILFALGIVLALLSRRLAKWLVPMPRRECPECGYTLEKLTSPRCPECGLELSGNVETSRTDAL